MRHATELIFLIMGNFLQYENHPIPYHLNTLFDFLGVCDDDPIVFIHDCLCFGRIH